jgi:hypothetical protein
VPDGVEEEQSRWLLRDELAVGDTLSKLTEELQGSRGILWS